MRPLIPVLALLTGAAALAVGAWQQQQARQERAALQGQQPSLIDIRYAQLMSLHHEQALVIAQTLLDAPPGAAALLAQGVRNQQLLELGQMQGWLRLWEQPAVPPSKSMDWMLLGQAPPDPELRQYLLDCQRANTGMPGLASPEELQKLRAASGSERQHWFLELMRRHHEGGLPMARFAAREARLPAVRELAARIVREQSEELMTIRSLQARLDTRPD